MTAIAVDFGSTNTVLGQWNPVTQMPEMLKLNGISLADSPLIPSVLFFRDAARDRLAVGNQASGCNLDSPNYFNQIKRRLLFDHAPDYVIDGVAVNAQLVGKLFLKQLFKQVTNQGIHPSSLIFTAPVAAYERYLRWLEVASLDLVAGEVRILDEPTAAALGYGIGERGALILVIDWGGGTLDVCLVRTPRAANRNQWGETLGDRPQQAECKVEVIAKTGFSIGGNDIDEWLLADFLPKYPDLQPTAALRHLMQRIKVSLSDQDAAHGTFYDAVNGQVYNLACGRSQLERVLRERGFYRVLQTAIHRVIRQSIAKGILKLDIKNIILVGGCSQIPSVKCQIQDAFPHATLHSDRPFSAVVAGAVYFSRGLGLNDHLFYDYAIRYWAGQAWQYQKLFTRGQTYPTKYPLELILRASVPDQTAIDLVIGELETQQSESVEVIFVGDRLVAQVNTDCHTRFLALNQEQPLTIPLQPLGKLGIDRLRLIFQISDRRQLLVTIVDLETGTTLFSDWAIAKLR